MQIDTPEGKEGAGVKGVEEVSTTVKGGRKEGSDTISPRVMGQAAGLKDKIVVEGTSAW